MWLPIRRTAKQSPCVTNVSHRAINQNIKIWKKRKWKNDKRLRLVAIGVWQTDSIIAHRSHSYSSSKPATDLCLQPNEFDFDFIARANYFWFATGSKLIHGTRRKFISISRSFRVYANSTKRGRCLLCETESKFMRKKVGASEVHSDIISVVFSISLLTNAANAGGDHRSNSCFLIVIFA